MIASDLYQDAKGSLTTEQASFKFSCGCKICYLESSGKCNARRVKSSTLKMDGYSSKGFTWLIEKLGEICNECPVKFNIPDTVIYRYGHPYGFLQFSRDRSLKYTKANDKLKSQEIIKVICNTSRTRKREEVSQITSKVMLSGTGTDYGKEVACLRFMSKNKTNDVDEYSSSDEEGAMKIMSENEFMGLLWQRPSSMLWRTLAYIQTVLKCRNGIGESFVHGHSFEGAETSDIFAAAHDDSEDNENNLYEQDKIKYTEYIYKRLYYVFEKFLNLRLEYIRGEFLKDENHRIWLIHASHIVTTVINTPKQPELVEEQPCVNVVKEDMEELLIHLASVSSEPKNVRTEKITRIMDEECKKIITANRFTNLFKTDEPDYETLNAYEKLRPLTPIMQMQKSIKKKKQSEGIKRSTSEVKKVILKRNSTDSSSPVKTLSPNKVSSLWIYTPKFRISPTKPSRSRLHSLKISMTPYSTATQL